MRNKSLQTLLVVGVLLLLAGCGGSPVGSISEFAIPTPESLPGEIVAGPDGAFWFTEYKGNKIGRITPEGAITEFAVPTSSSQPNSLLVGPDGNLWFAELNRNKIARITPAGRITEFP